MKRIILVLLLILNFSSCNNEERESRKRGQEQFIGSLIIGGLIFQPNFCEPPQLLLEEGQTYNITLEAGKRFWFDYAVRSQGETISRYRLTVSKDSSTELNHSDKYCPENSIPTPFIPKVNTSTLVVYEYDSQSYSEGDGGFEANRRFYLESKEGNPNISIIFMQF